MNTLNPTVSLFGLRSVLVGVPDAERARRTANVLRAAPGLDPASVVPAADSVLVTSSTLSGDPLLAAVTAALADAEDATLPSGMHHVLPVRYDGDDLSEVADLLGVSPVEVVARHSAATYTVDFLGFAPGFPYLSGLDPFLATVPRLDTPRTRIPAGSVGLAAGKTCVYPTSSPGGWRLLGITEVTLFDAANESRPSLLMPGDSVRFEAVR